MTEPNGILDNTTFKFPHLIGICGDKGAGKDTLAKELERAFGYKIVRMSTPLKHAASHIFGLDLKRCDDNDYKDTPLPESHVYPFIGPHQFLARVLEATSFVYAVSAPVMMTSALLTPTGQPACVIMLKVYQHALEHLAPLVFDEGWQPSLRPTPRKLQQIIGTEVYRAVDPDIWVWRWAQAAAMHSRVVVPDLRFDNEYGVMKSKQATLVRITRNSVARDSSHSSEGGLDELPVDHEIENNGTINQLRATALRKLIETDELPLPVSRPQTLQ